MALKSNLVNPLSASVYISCVHNNARPYILRTSFSFLIVGKIHWGWLWKRGRSTFRNWKHRYFELVVHLTNNKAELVYKKKREAHRKKGSFEFGPNTTINTIEGGFEGRNFCLSMSAQSERRMFYICAKYVNSIYSYVRETTPFATEEHAPVHTCIRHSRRPRDQSTRDTWHFQIKSILAYLKAKAAEQHTGRVSVARAALVPNPRTVHDERADVARAISSLVDTNIGNKSMRCGANITKYANTEPCSMETSIGTYIETVHTSALAGTSCTFRRNSKRRASTTCPSLSYESSTASVRKSTHTHSDT